MQCNLEYLRVITERYSFFQVWDLQNQLRCQWLELIFCCRSNVHTSKTNSDQFIPCRLTVLIGAKRHFASSLSNWIDFHFAESILKLEYLFDNHCWHCGSAKVKVQQHMHIPSIIDMMCEWKFSFETQFNQNLRSLNVDKANGLFYVIYNLRSSQTKRRQCRQIFSWKRGNNFSTSCDEARERASTQTAKKMKLVDLVVVVGRR